MSETQGVAQLMQRHAVEIRIGPDAPTLVVVEMNIAGQRLGIGWRRIERVGQRSAGAVERVRIAVNAGGEQKVDCAGRGRARSGHEVEPGVPRPFLECALELLAHLVS